MSSDAIAENRTSAEFPTTPDPLRPGTAPGFSLAPEVHMPHPDYTLPRDVAAVLARSAVAARYVATWYTTGNPEQARAALRQACAAVLSHGAADMEPDERSAVALVLADLEALPNG